MRMGKGVPDPGRESIQVAEEPLSRAQILSYSLPAFGAAMILISVSVYLPKFYTDELLVGPALLSWVFLLGRFWDGFTDPVMGHLSDRTKSRWGRRRPARYATTSLAPCLWPCNRNFSSRGTSLRPRSEF